jgi:hypothetical protein
VKWLLIALIVPALYVGGMALAGATLDNRKALWMAVVMILGIVLFAGFTTWH